MVVSGNTLTLNLALTFAPAFAGTQDIYLYAQTATVQSNWVQEGTWTVPAAAGPAPVSVTPSSGSGTTQTFAFAFSDPAGAPDILSVQIIINSSLSRTNGCAFYFYAGGSNIIYLADNAGNFGSSLPLGTAGTQQNSQCAVNAGASSVALSGNTLTLNLALSFTPAFAGTQDAYLYVQNATVGSNWVEEGTWTVPAVSGPAPASVTPASGSGATQTFAFAFSDAAGAADIASVQIIINSSLTRTNGCAFLYGSNVVYLANNAGNFGSSLPIGSAGTEQNSQCTLNVGASSVALSGNTLTVNVALSFTPAFAGTQNVYLWVENATLESNWVQEGTWTVPAASGPAPLSVTPSSGSGLTQTLAFAFSDPAGASDILSVQIIINSSLSRTNGCAFYFYGGASNIIYLADNAGDFGSSLPIGTAGTQQNSQCAVNAGASSVVAAGNTLTLNLALSFTSAFAGAQDVYLYAQNATVGSNWVQEGTWTVP